MSAPNKTPSTLAFRLMLYQRALHPELFSIKDRRIITQPTYELEAWLMPGAHSMRFQTAKHCLVEVAIEQDSGLPERGLINSLPCIGEKEHDQTLDEQVRFLAAVQTENLSENLFNATYNEMLDFVEETNAMSYKWSNKDGLKNLSVLDIQRYRGEIHAQSYHLFRAPGFILRTQSIFEVLS